jgi:hypothetical protein
MIMAKGIPAAFVVSYDISENRPGWPLRCSYSLVFFIEDFLHQHVGGTRDKESSSTSEFKSVGEHVEDT